MPQGTTYATFVRAEIDREFARRDSINSRAATVVTTSTGLATLTFAAVGVVRGQGTKLHAAAVTCILVAVVLLLAAALTAVAAGVSREYQVLTAETLTSLLTARWGDSETTALSRLSQRSISTLSTLRAGNNRKSDWLHRAYVLQAVSILGLGAALVFVV